MNDDSVNKTYFWKPEPLNTTKLIKDDSVEKAEFIKKRKIEFIDKKKVNAEERGIPFHVSLKELTDGTDYEEKIFWVYFDTRTKDLPKDDFFIEMFWKFKEKEAVREKVSLDVIIKRYEMKHLLLETSINNYLDIVEIITALENPELGLIDASRNLLKLENGKPICQINSSYKKEKNILYHLILEKYFKDCEK